LKKERSAFRRYCRGGQKGRVSVVQHQGWQHVLCFFTAGEVYDWPTAAACDTKAFATYFRAMLEAGIYLAPSQFETAFVSQAHTDADIEATIAAARNCFKLIA